MINKGIPFFIKLRSSQRDPNWIHQQFITIIQFPSTEMKMPQSCNNSKVDSNS